LIELNAERNVGIDEWAPPTLARCPIMTRADASVIIVVLLALLLVRLVAAPMFGLASELAFLIGIVTVLESARNLRAFVVDDYPVVLALSLGWVAVLRALHTAAEPSVALLVGAGPVLQEEFELAAYVLLGAGMLLAPFAIGRRLRLGRLIAIQAFAALLLIAAILWWPALPAVGSDETATLFAVAVGVAASAALAAAALITYRRRHLLTRPFFVAIEMALCLATVAALLESVFRHEDLTHLLGVAFVALVYIAVTRNGLERPMSLMVDNLKENEREATRQRARALQELQSSEARYRSLFEDSPVAMWEEDHAVVMSQLRQLVAAGVPDVAAHLLAHPKDYKRCIALTRVRDVNTAAVTLFEASSRADLVARADDVYPPGTRSGLCFFWAALLAGEQSAEFDETSVTLGGRRLHLLETCTVAPGHEKTFDRVYVADIDVTARREAEQQLRSTLNATVAAFAAATQLRDPYTAGHQRRVAELAVAIAGELGWDADDTDTLRTAAHLHDIGKTAVPSEILSMPRRLSETEMQLVQEHCRAGAEIVAGIDFGKRDIAQVIAQHHERLDGSGYPAGLAGDEILPEARIIAVADVIEAMLSHRPYRPALPLEQALAEIESGASTRYDAAACEAAARLLREEGFTFGE
jgi:putative nucleotidyltransferase with HDIG domain